MSVGRAMVIVCDHKVSYQCTIVKWMIVNTKQQIREYAWGEGWSSVTMDPRAGRLVDYCPDHAKFHGYAPGLDIRFFTPRIYATVHGTGPRDLGDREPHDSQEER